LIKKIREDIKQMVLLSVEKYIFLVEEKLDGIHFEVIELLK
jgi:hypothetical protein